MNPPTDLTASLGLGGIVLHWTADAWAAEYIVYRAPTRGGTYARIGSIARPPYTDTDHLSGATAWYRVAAVDGEGKTGPQSEPARADLLPWLIIGGAAAAATVPPYTRDDYPAADRWWRRHVPASYANLINAHALRSPQGWRGPGWAWSVQDQRWINPRGKPMGDDERHRLAQVFTDSTGHEFADLSRDMTGGRMTLAEWEVRMRRMLREYLLAQAAFGVGGLNELTPDDLRTAFGSVADRFGLSFNVDRLNRFAEGIENRITGADDADVVGERSTLYGHAGWNVLETLRRAAHDRMHDNSGRKLFRFEFNQLDDTAVHCVFNPKHPQIPDCPSLTAAGWMPIGTMPMPGGRVCQTRCRCTMRYLLAPPGSLGKN